MNSQIQTEEKTIESKIIENNDLQGNEVKEVEKKEPTYIKEERKANKKVKIIILFSFIFVLAILSTIFAIINIKGVCHYTFLLNHIFYQHFLLLNQ